MYNLTAAQYRKQSNGICASFQQRSYLGHNIDFRIQIESYELDYVKDNVQMITGHRSDAVLAYDVKKQRKVEEMQDKMWRCIQSGKNVEEFAQEEGTRASK